MLSVRRPFVLLLAVPALLAACSATPAPTAAESSSPPAITANPTPVSTDAPSAPATSEPATTTACPSGEYRATSFTAVGANSATGKGTVREVDATFRNGRYTLEFDDDHPVTLTINKRSTQVRVDGDIRGSYTGDADALTFTVGDTTGRARVTTNGKSQSFPMKQVATILGPQGKGSAVCSGNDLTIKTGTVTWELVRDLDD